MHQNTGSSQSRIQKDIQETSCWTKPTPAPQSDHHHWLDAILCLQPQSHRARPSPQSLDICSNCGICRDTHSVKELCFVIHSHTSCFCHPFTHQHQQCNSSARDRENCPSPPRQRQGRQQPSSCKRAPQRAGNWKGCLFCYMGMKIQFLHTC